MNYIDFHTHHPSREYETVICQGIHSWGIHPCSIPPHWESCTPPPHLVAIGECGLDKTSPTPLATQMQVFQQHIRWSQAYGRPLIIHCVHALDELLLLRRQQRNPVPWIFHGFRGKTRQLQSLLSFGFHVSFGFRFAEESLRACPLDRMLLETDAEERPVGLLYERVSAVLDVPLSVLTDRMQHNYDTLFPF